MPIKIQAFDPTAKEKQWIANERRTAWAIQTLWAYASKNQRKDADFVEAKTEWKGGAGRTQLR